MKRRITAIMCADVVGYSRLVAEDEEEALRRLLSYRGVFEAFIKQADGRIFNTAGDAVLAEFPSAVDAVRAAIDIQESLRTRNLAYPTSRKMHFRIGITIGDVVEQDGDLLGDAVNIAARLQTLAAPGGICLSQTVREQVANKLSAQFRDLGAQSVKNIPQEIRAFTVEFGAAPEAAPAPAPTPRRSGMAGWAVAAAAILLLVAGGVVAFQRGLFGPGPAEAPPVVAAVPEAEPPAPEPAPAATPEPHAETAALQPDEAEPTEAPPAAQPAADPAPAPESDRAAEAEPIRPDPVPEEAPAPAAPSGPAVTPAEPAEERAQEGGIAPDLAAAPAAAAQPAAEAPAAEMPVAEAPSEPALTAAPPAPEPAAPSPPAEPEAPVAAPAGGEQVAALPGVPLPVARPERTPEEIARSRESMRGRPFRVSEIPFVCDDCRGKIETQFAPAKASKALAINPQGDTGWSWGWSSQRRAIQEALESCRKENGRPCELYAVDGRVVWDHPAPLLPPLPWVDETAPAEPFSVANVPFIAERTRQTLQESYVDAAGPKALAVAPDGSWSYYTKGNSVDEVMRRALETCSFHAGRACRIVALNDTMTIVPAVPAAVTPAGEAAPQ